MADNSAIEWTDATWTPIRARNLKTGKVGWHCEHATTGCEFCYAEGMNKRLGTGLPFKPGHRKDIEIFLDEKMLLAPLKWKRPRMIFVCSMTDLFADFVTDEWIDQVFAVMALTPWHTYQVLTKRSARMREYMADPLQHNRMEIAAEAIKASDGKPWSPKHVLPRILPNVWLGVSAERQQEADERIPDLLLTPAAVRFISAEPLLGPVDLAGRGWLPPNLKRAAGRLEPPYIDWLIVGGESGPGARPMHPDWARSLRDQCEDAGVKFFFKQHGGWIDWRQAGAGCWTNTTPQRASYKGPMIGKLSRQGVDLFDGRSFPTVVSYGEGGTTFVHVGKHLAGRLLDNREHNGMPELRG